MNPVHDTTDSDRSKTIEIKAETIEEIDDIHQDDPVSHAVSIDDDSSASTSQPAEDGDGLTNNGNGNEHHLLNYDQLKTVDRPTLIKLANLHNLSNYKSRKRDELATMLDGMVTSEELDKASNGKHA